tara:strand:- start:70 stop:969 length:900 start_codon:yes stop_codon:yes gene_type:complete
MANYIYAFDSAVYDTTKMGDPAPINVDANAAGHGGTYPLSAANNSFALISAGKVNNKDVEGVLFNYVAGASAHHLDDFYLQAPNHPDHPSFDAVAVISLSGQLPSQDYGISSASYMRLQTTNGNISTFYAVPSATTAGNTGDSKTTGSTFYSNTGTNTDILHEIQNAINFHGTAGSFNAELAIGISELSIQQLVPGAAGNTTIAVSGGGTTQALSSVVMVLNQFSGGTDVLSDSTHIRAAAGLNTTDGYDGATVSVVATDGFTATYVLDHATQSTTPVLSGFNVATGPNMRRDVLMGYR